ncbi:hypothetical protein FNV43_RR16408 [Rhamnella rubrinervis]|uniref:B3 domain-containing protein n=1 Tax=Rhamnella rubrinervis TaxID=2594499 RepID=A0A8K0MD07_9ROSA|nr:hypothetical protein FNV43_RR16408 [Rhamnella rubrinervis]
MEEELSLFDLSLSIGGRTREAEQHYSAPIAPPMATTVNNKRPRCSTEQVEVSTELTLSLSVPGSKKPTETQESGSTNNSTLTIEEVASGSPIQSRHNAHAASSKRLDEEDDHQVSSTNYQEDEVSLELTLGLHCHSRTAKKQRKMSAVYPEGDTEEDTRRELPTWLELEPWKIRKHLTTSDLGNLSRLLLKKKTVQEHVLCYMSERLIKDVNSNAGAKVSVWDSETRTAHDLVLKLWPSCQSYVLIGKWTKEFVERRELKKDDEIGLYWSSFASMFHFCVLHRAPQTNTLCASS